MTTELVLVVKAQDLNLSAREYISDAREIDAFLEAAKGFSFMPRPAAEQDAAYKQLIPYVSVICNEHILTLERTTAQGETRLHGKMSLGVGGHINPEDRGEDLLATISQAMARELREELWLQSKVPPVLAGLINDDTNSVGSVHLGIHYILPVQTRPRVRETDKMIARWLQPHQLEDLAPRLETWSQILLPHLARAGQLPASNAPATARTARP
ncbi:MAG: NUDIX domain-containing protein [Bacillota bacterium]|jgi:predicted NUDIX family phosphoesterase|nr:NUDIX domain-containing protein [Bacillota bacterium]HPZ21816.1 NUDIX domain-containing protein [Bacillota bacterium]HQD19410.1 NUDIX domain-containing protein [Bacillota bacterium]